PLRPAHGRRPQAARRPAPRCLPDRDRAARAAHGRRPGHAAPPARPHPHGLASTAPAELVGGARPGSRGAVPRVGAVGGGAGERWVTGAALSTPGCWWLKVEALGRRRSSAPPCC